MLLSLNNNKITVTVIIVILIIILVGFSFWAYQSGYNKGLKTKQTIANKYQNSPVTDQVDKTTDLKFDDSKYEIEIDLEAEEATFGDMRTYGKKSDRIKSNTAPTTDNGYEIEIPDENYQ